MLKAAEQFLKGKRIFVIEDDPYNLGIIISILTRHGAAVHYDSWGFSTLTRIQSFLPIDLILMDVKPSTIDSFSVFEQLMQYQQLKHTQVAALSIDSISIMNETQRRGFAGFITKPIQMNTFPQMIFALCKGEQVWGALPSYASETSVA